MMVSATSAWCLLAGWAALPVSAWHGWPTHLINQTLLNTLVEQQQHTTACPTTKILAMVLHRAPDCAWLYTSLRVYHANRRRLAAARTQPCEV